MSPIEEQSILLQIVETWRLSETPEYRGFRCANCQQYKNKAWYHWLNTDGYKLPIHLCDDTCEPAFQNKTIEVDQTKRQIVDRKTFGDSYTYSPEAKKRFNEIIVSWPDHKDPELKAYTCDECEKELDIDPADGFRKGYHVWWKMNLSAGRQGDGKTLAELHFHKDCAAFIGITEPS